MTKIIGIDQSLTKTAIVYCVNGELMAHKVITTAPSDDPCARLHHITQLVQLFITQHLPDLVIMEGLSFKSIGRATRETGGIFYMISAMVRFQLNIPLKIIPPTSLKKEVTGHGHAKKEQLFDTLPHKIQLIFLSYSVAAGKFDLSDAFSLTKCDKLTI